MADAKISIRSLTALEKSDMRIPYSLRRIPADRFSALLPVPTDPRVGDVVLARIESMGKKSMIDLAKARRCALHVGDTIAVSFCHRYATSQYEAYARADGDRCHLLTMGGTCGLVTSHHGAYTEVTKLRILGAIGDASGQPLRLRDFALSPVPVRTRPRVLVVCGTSMDSGKTTAASGIILGLHRAGQTAAGIKLTGSAGSDDPSRMEDAGACAVFDFVDGGYPSTFKCTLEELLYLYETLISHAAAAGARWVIVEVADGLLQEETSALIQCAAFKSTVDAWVFTSGDSLGIFGGVSLLRSWGIEPLAFSGLITLSPLALKEAQSAVRLPCFTSSELQAGGLNPALESLKPR